MENNQVISLENTEIPATKIQEALKEIDFKDPTLTISYGTKTMEGISKFADSILSNVRVKDSGEVGAQLSTLLQNVKGVDIQSIASPKKSILQYIPFIGGLFDKVSSTIAQFDTVSEQIDGIAGKLDDAQMNLLKDIEVLEQLYDKNKDFYGDLSAYIKAGEQRLEEARKLELPALEAKAEETKDNLDAQNVRDFAEALNRFERRLHDLKLSRTITLQTAPQIRMIQNNDRTLAEKIQTSVLATIPIWKNQMVLALSIHSQKSAAKLQKDVADTTNAMLKKNAEMLQTATVETAREVERGIVDVETLKEVQEKLLSTIEETINIANEGRERRQNTELELKKMEEDLRVRLTDLAARKREQVISNAHGESASGVQK
ncbi:MAG TPA: toxic anion resistance protein [Succinivibrionaceae bacterium]|nr:toxic anion resistance protein [Succinivibrionaceae bacterium]